MSIEEVKAMPEIDIYIEIGLMEKHINRSVDPSTISEAKQEPRYWDTDQYYLEGTQHSEVTDLYGSVARNLFKSSLILSLTSVASYVVGERIFHVQPRENPTYYISLLGSAATLAGAALTTMVHQAKQDWHKNE